MTQRVLAIVGIYVLACLAWLVLGGSIEDRTKQADGRLSEKVQSLWGEPQAQVAPELRFAWKETVQESETVEDQATHEKKTVTKDVEKSFWKPVLLDGSDVDVGLALDQRRKGLLWYPTYDVTWRGRYVYRHEGRDGELVIRYRFPVARANYADFRFAVRGVEDPRATPLEEGAEKLIVQRVPVRRGDVVPFEIGYRSRGLDRWTYSFGKDVNRVRNFRLAMRTDFEQIDFPEGTISPGAKQRTGRGWLLTWESANLISGFAVGMEMPRRLNPGPLAARIAFFAPVSLGFFFVWMFVITLLEKVELHPMNYLFLAAAFFAFHLVLSYTADHLPLAAAFGAASVVSVFLVISYLRLVAGLRFAAVEAGLAQLVYLVLFAWAHFFEGFTGLIVTVGSVLTLFALMQATGRLRWSEIFAGGRPETVPGLSH